MTTRDLILSISLLAAAAISGQAQEEPQSWGWRGDGSGRYPEATPPLAWSQKSKELRGLSCQAERPNPDSKRARSDLSDGVIKEWLVLGPFDAKGADKAKPFENFQLKDEAGLSPAPGDMTDGKAWKATETIGSLVEPALVFKQDMLEKAACFYTNIHSAEDAEIYLNARTRWWSKLNSLEVWLNGTKLSGHPPVVTFKKGWNRLLMKVISTAVMPEKDEGKDLQPNFGVLLWTANKQAEYVTENILWKTPLPQDLKAWGRKWSSASQPVIAGDKVFATAEPQTLTCFNKDTGKILWMRSVNFSDVATAEEREKKAKYFTEIDPLNRRAKELDRLADTRALTPEEITEKASADKGLFKLTFKVNPKKYYKVSIQEGGMSAPTPVTDGKRIYVYYGGSGIVACYDLDGNRQWIYHLPAPAAHHCYASSPCIVDGKLLFLGGQKGKQYNRIRTLVSLDCMTGKELFQEDIGTGSTIASSPMPGKIADRDVLAMRGLLDPKTGKTICRIDYMHGIPSPIF
ncbi:MAG: PQQ-binding-like beta-propeller repeat protein, partial [Planctomycetota bacterium]|nr:PQQ-binding-like beta-propeller repeat protein [Planctomycetota bacterium]